MSKRVGIAAATAALAVIGAMPVGAAPRRATDPPAVATPQVIISFAGRDWVVQPPTSTGPNSAPYWDLSTSVWTDSSGHLHLRLDQVAGKWVMPQVQSTSQLGYGTYRWYVEGNPSQLDPNVIFGMFVLNPRKDSGKTHEIDIEETRLGGRDGKNAQFVVQPYWAPKHWVRYRVPNAATRTIQQFTWTAGRAEFSAWAGTTPDRRHLVRHYVFTGPDVPPASGVFAYMNLWLTTSAPANGQPVETVLDNFTFTPAG